MPWWLGGEGGKDEYLDRLESHDRPQVQAIPAYEAEPGWSPPELSALLPEHLDHLPEREP